MKMGTIISPLRYDVAACHVIETPILHCSAISYCASRQSPERLSPPAWTLLASVLSLAEPSRAGHPVRSSLVRRCFEEARCLNESAIGAKAAEAAPLHEGPAILVVHRPEEESLVVMFEKAVVSEYAPVNFCCDCALRIMSSCRPWV